MARLLGIDATADAVRIALVRTSYRRFAIEAFAEVEVAPFGSELEAIRAVVGTLKPEAVSIGMSGDRCFYRRIELPAAAVKEIQNVLGYELEATMPFEMEEGVFDYRVLKRPSGQSDTLPVFAGIGRVEDVRERVTIAREALGIDPERVGTGGSPLANLTAIYPALEKAHGPIALVNLAESTTDVLILVGGEPAFTRTISRGTRGLPQMAGEMVRELRHTVTSWRSLGGDIVAGMVLFGPGAQLPNADTFLSTELGIPIFPLPPPKLEGLTPERAFHLARFSRAVGLALGLHKNRGFNLRKGVLEPERAYPFLREKIPLLSGIAAVIAVSFGFSVIAELRTLAGEHDLLLAKLGVASHEVLGEETQDPDKAHELLEGPGKEEEDPMPHADGFDGMVQLSKAVPKDIVHDVIEFDFQRQHLNVQGTVPSVGDAETILKALKEYKCARDAKIARTSQFGEGKQKYVLELDIKCVDTKKKKPTTSEADAASSAAAPGSSAKTEPVKDGGR